MIETAGVVVFSVNVRLHKQHAFRNSARKSVNSCVPQERSKCFSRVEKYGHWPAVHKLDFHHGLKLSCLAVHAGGAYFADKVFIKSFCLFRPRRVIERWPTA